MLQTPHLVFICFTPHSATCTAMGDERRYQRLELPAIPRPKDPLPLSSNAALAHEKVNGAIVANGHMGRTNLIHNIQAVSAPLEVVAFP